MIALSKRLGYTFKDPELLRLALTHRSISSGPHNERLEFLGDSVLGIIIAESLYQQFPHAQEGQLSRLRSSLVKGETLAAVAQSFQLGDELILGIGELKNGGHRRVSILENALEAIIGAIYLDSNFNTCREVVLNWFTSRLATLSLKDNVRDPKSRLQEYLQGKGLALPIYEIIRTEGEEHKQTFWVRCTVEALTVVEEAQGLSRKAAEQQSAEMILKKLELQ
jgi:ribonuclease-3